MEYWQSFNSWAILFQIFVSVYLNDFWHFSEENLGEYKIFSNKVTKLKATAKKNYYADELEKNKSNSRKTWELLRTILPGKSPKSSNLPTSIRVNEKEISEKQSILEEFNKYFSNIGENLADKFKSDNPETYKLYLRNEVKSSIFMEPPRVNEVKNLMNSLNLRKSVGHDNISSYYLRIASDILSPVLCYFIDNAFRLGIFQQNCKKAKIIPLYKTGKPNNLTNYRPISILTCFSKIIEKLIHKRLSSFFDKHSILAKTQYGFQAGKSTSHAILDVLTTAYEHINNHEYTGPILLDFKKAFDTVSHSILLYKLEHYGIRGVANKLLKSFLSDRSQFVSHHNSSSDTLINRFGVPQGSNLGPLLFLIYINDIPHALNSNPRLFADDTCLNINAVTPAMLSEKMNLELTTVHKWTTANKITVNPQKSHCLIIPPKKNHRVSNISIYFNDSVIKINDTVIYLGITIDNKLNFEEHINALATKISRSLGVLCKLRHILPKSALRILYHSMIHPHLLYGITVWGNAFDKHLKRLATLQNKAVKLISGAQWRDHVTPTYLKLQILKLNDLYLYEVAKLMHKHTRKKLPTSFSTFFAPVKAIHTRSTRLASSELNLYLPRYKSQKLQKSFKYQGVKIWNSIPQDLKQLPFNRFKTKYKKHLLSKYTVNEFFKHQKGVIDHNIL